jgi:hypothetical protein
MQLDGPLVSVLPPPEKVRAKLGDTLREVELLRRLLRLAERAERYRECDGQVRGRWAAGAGDAP